MIWALAAVAVMSVPTIGVTEVSPGDAIGLAPNPVVRSGTSSAGASSHGSPSGMFPVSLPFAGVAVLSAASLVYTRRRNDEPLLVLVHGDGGSAEDFDYLIDEMNVDPTRIVSFDYSDVSGVGSSTSSSRTVSTASAADALDALLRDLAEQNSNIYSIHHSRGGAVGVEMIANIDEGSRPPIDGYRGASLLDPAIASGFIGELQSIGGSSIPLLDRIPDDGGFNPIRCGLDGCRDVREHLGHNAGVEVVAIKNPDAVVTNFEGAPEGLRTFELVDNKPSALWYFLVNPIFGAMRSSEAHGSVLADEHVAACIAAEIDEPGSCIGLATPASR
ncbi:MAG: hypothetical protein O3B42_01525 [Actinomycetota bacterium]|nr:hypothetical protein [Actinomycetota bacterium]